MNTRKPTAETSPSGLRLCLSIEAFSPEHILSAADELNGRSRKKLGDRAPEELFEAFLDSIYAIPAS